MTSTRFLRALRLTVLLAVLGVSSLVAVQTSMTSAEAAPEQARDPWLRPFTSTSIWNMPIGSNARYVAANFPYTKHHPLEDRYLLQTRASDPVRTLFRTGNWRDRCSGTKTSGDTLHLPDGWQPTQVGPTGPTPNNPGVFLQPDGRTLYNMGAMGRCSPTGPLYAQWPSIEKFKTDLYGDGRYGGHGASKLSHLGGSIRPGEMNGPEPIRHALDLVVWVKHLYWGGSKASSYRWPASSSDAYAGPSTYQGDNPQLRMGSLVAIPPNVTAAELGLTTKSGRKIFDALRDYGAYLTDDSAWDATYLGVDADAIGTFAWGAAEREDMARMVMALHVVANNGPQSIGGGGEPRQPLLPELVDPGRPGGSSVTDGTRNPSRTARTLVLGSALAPAERLGPVAPTSTEPASTPTGPGGHRPVDEALVFDSFDGEGRLDQRSSPEWDVPEAVIRTAGGSASVESGGGSVVALTDAGSADVAVSSSIELSTGRSAPGLALRADGRNEGLIVSLVIRRGHNRVSLHALEGGKYQLLGETDDFGLEPGRVYQVRATAAGGLVTVEVDGREAVRHRLSERHRSVYGTNTTHGLRMMRNSMSDDGGSRWLDVGIDAA